MPDWVVVSCATAIALGTYAGGWRIIKTLGTKVVEVRPPQGFGSETVAATVILASSHVGYPLSTTQVVSGAVAGSGVGRPGAIVNWSSRATSSSAGSDAARCRRHRRGRPTRSSTLLGGGAFGVIVVSVALVIGCCMLWRANRRQAGEARGDGLRSSRPSARRPPPEAVAA